MMTVAPDARGPAAGRPARARPGRAGRRPPRTGPAAGSSGGTGVGAVQELGQRAGDQRADRLARGVGGGADPAGQVGGELDGEHHRRSGHRDGAERAGPFDVAAGLPLRQPGAVGQRSARLDHGHPCVQQLGGGVDPLRSFVGPRPPPVRHDTHMLLLMSTPAQSLPSHVRQDGLELEVAYCVGGVASPILSSIYLHKLDEFVETVLIPEYTRGDRRVRNPAYLELQYRLAKARRRGDRAQARTLRRQMVSLPSADPNDPGYRRLRYCRYADDHLLGFTGPKAEAEEIKQRLAAFLREDLKLELSADKTLITHARTGAARFLGYEITVQHNSSKTTRRRRTVNGQVALRVPLDVIKATCSPYLHRGKPAKQKALTNGDDYTIVATFGAIYRGIVQYYLLAGDVHRLHRLRWVMETSMLKTLAGKHRSSTSKMAAKHRA